MTGADFLLCIAQVSVTFAGFAGLIGIFRSSEAKWMPQEVAGLGFILHHSLGAVFLSLLGVESEMWTLCSGLLAAFLLAETTWQLREVLRLAKLGRPPRRRAILYSTLAGSVLVASLALYGAMRGGPQAIYETGLLWLLAASGVQFLVFVRYFASISETADHSQRPRA
jgi:hypothetical protein